MVARHMAAINQHNTESGKNDKSWDKDRNMSQSGTAAPKGTLH